MVTMASSLPPGFEGAAMGSLSANHMVPQTNVSSQQGRVSKKVSWASEDNLCQVRLFAAEDAPAQSSATLQEFLQAKKAKMMHMINPAKSEDLPPGFGGRAITKGIQLVAFDVSAEVPWRIPEEFKLDPSWLVMAGQESIEVSVQKKRENRTLEAVYPRPSAIPDSPAEPSEAQLSFDDANTLIIPVVPLEDDDLPDQDEVPTTSGSTYEVLQEYTFPREKSFSPPPGFPSQTGIPTKSRPWFPESSQEVSTSITVSSTAPAVGPPISTTRNTMPPNGITMHATSLSSARSGPLAPPARSNEAGPDVAAAAAAAYAALSQSNDTTMIDRELLIKFLTNPSMLQNLSEKLAQNPPGTIGSLEPHTGNGARGNGRSWNPSAIEQNKGGQRYLEASIPSADSLPGHGYDRPPGFGAPSLGANGLGQAPQSLGQGYAPPRPLNMQGLPPQSPSPPISAAQPTVSGSGRSISQRDDQYYKDLISQHGRKNEENVWGGVGAVDTGNSYPGGGRPRANGPERDRKLDKSERTERPERADSGARWAERDDMDIAGMPVRQGDADGRSGQSRGKSRKACIYFSTSRGCRNGNTCAFVHETNNGERAKRPKLEGKDSKGYR
ncbi:hypothetical protein M758_5G183300 [Ceratodon purpureus]|nr:hypothetical protein M758_5G183300 [Ceratodon purpureus]